MLAEVQDHFGFARDPQAAGFVEVTVTDRGPYVTGRIIDLTPMAFETLFGSTKRGTGKVVVAIPGKSVVP